MVQIPWTAPATFTDGAVLTAAQLNAMRDNFNETAPAKVTTASGYLVGTGLNAIAQRVPSGDYAAVAGTTTSPAYGDLSGTTVGPTVTATTGPFAYVATSSTGRSDVADRGVIFSYEVSGATTNAATDTTAGVIDGQPANNPLRIGVSTLHSLTAGSNTFTMKYRLSVTGSTGTFLNRRIIVLPF